MLLCFSPAVAQDEAAQAPFEPAIPPGHEQMLIDMLGVGGALPGDCELANGVADFTTVKVTYTCPAGDVVIQLAHPGKATASSIKTERFALSVYSGKAPERLTETVAEFVRAKEGSFTWTTPADFDPAGGGSAQ